MHNEWLIIIGMVLNLMNSVEYNQLFEMEMKWVNPEVYQMSSPNTDSSLVIDFRTKECSQPITTLIIFPRNDIYPFQSSDEIIPSSLELFLFSAMGHPENFS